MENKVCSITQLEKDVASLLTKAYEQDNFPFELKACLCRISKEHSNKIRNKKVKKMHDGLSERKSNFEHYTEIFFVAKFVEKNSFRDKEIFTRITENYGKRISDARSQGMDGFGLSIIPLHSKHEEKDNLVIIDNC